MLFLYYIETTCTNFKTLRIVVPYYYNCIAVVISSSLLLASWEAVRYRGFEHYILFMLASNNYTMAYAFGF